MGITFTSVYVERLFKTRKCAVKDLLFKMGLLGFVFCLFEAIPYGFVNAVTLNVPVGY